MGHERERESGQKYFLGRFRNLLCTPNGLLVGKAERGNAHIAKMGHA